jgi:hypothetical protein
VEGQAVIPVEASLVQDEDGDGGIPDECYEEDMIKGNTYIGYSADWSQNLEVIAVPISINTLCTTGILSKMKSETKLMRLESQNILILKNKHISFGNRSGTDARLRNIPPSPPIEGPYLD